VYLTSVWLCPHAWLRCTVALAKASKGVYRPSKNFDDFCDALDGMVQRRGDGQASPDCNLLLVIQTCSTAKERPLDDLPKDNTPEEVAEVAEVVKLRIRDELAVKARQRVVDELSKARITFPLNLRDYSTRGISPNTSRRSRTYTYSSRSDAPPPDFREFVRSFRRGEREYDSELANRYAAFLCSLFRAAKLLLAPLVARGLGYGALAKAWHDFLHTGVHEKATSPQRTRLYKAVMDEAEVSGKAAALPQI
jgi:hypothetical protein